MKKNPPTGRSAWSCHIKPESYVSSADPPARNRIALRRRVWLGLLILILTAPYCLATNLSFVGGGAYNISGNTVVLTANELINNDIWTLSGTIRLELWAFAVPYPGTTVGYKLATYVLGQLNGGYYFYNINSGSIPFTTPSPGVWYFSLQAREYVGGGGDGYTTRAWINFSPVRVAGGANWGDVQISGITSWQFIGSAVNVSVQQVKNICDLGTSGSLRLDLWATLFPYSGGIITGYRFASLDLNPLTGGYAYNNINQLLTYFPPPEGVYYVTLTLSEYNTGEYVIDSYVNYGSFLTVGNAPPAPLVNPAGGVTSSGFTANWSSAVGATGYRVDIASDSVFSSYLSGYQNLNAGNVTSLIVTGLAPGTKYFYRVRAYNGVGTSGNSSTVTATTLVSPPPTPTANAANSLTSTTFVANWSADNGATGYRLDVSLNGGFTSYAAGYQNLDVGNTTSRSVTGLAPGTTYYYRVRAYSAGGTSASSATIPVITVPPVPAVNAASSVSSNVFTANWSSATGATGYRLDVSANSTFTSYVNGYQNLDVASALSQVISGLSPNTLYYYRVAAYNATGTSLPSVTASVATTSAPSAPPTLSIRQSGTNVVLSWPTNLVGYRVESATNFLVGGWNTNYPTPVIVAGRYTVTNPITRPVKAYRLFKP